MVKEEIEKLDKNKENNKTEFETELCAGISDNMIEVYKEKLKKKSRFKLKPKDLEIGDIVKVKFSKQEIECYGFVAEKINGLYDPETFEEKIATIVDIMVPRENGTYFYCCRKLDEDMEYEVVYRFDKDMKERIYGGEISEVSLNNVNFD